MKSNNKINITITVDNNPLISYRKIMSKKEFFEDYKKGKTLALEEWAKNDYIYHPTDVKVNFLNLDSNQQPITIGFNVGENN